MVNESDQAVCATLDYWNLCKDAVKQIRESEVPGGMAHACEFETSLMLSLDEESVCKDRLQKEISYTQTDMVWHDLFEKSPVHIAESFTKLSKSGVIGDPTLATQEKGDFLIGNIVANFVSFLKELKNTF